MVTHLKLATVLITVTPYRNDYKLLNVDPAHVFSYSHHNAVRDLFIREDTPHVGNPVTSFDGGR